VGIVYIYTHVGIVYIYTCIKNPSEIGVVNQLSKQTVTPT
jgi:hypothetical protein